MERSVILTKENGGLIFSSPLEYLYSQLKNGKYKVKIESYAEKRTLNQNALMGCGWPVLSVRRVRISKMCMTIIALGS